MCVSVGPGAGTVPTTAIVNPTGLPVTCPVVLSMNFSTSAIGKGTTTGVAATVTGRITDVVVP